MSIIRITQTGSFDKTEKYLRGLNISHIRPILEKYGREGVDALSRATPVDSGETAQSWYYDIEEKTGYISIHWRNRHIHDGRPIAILIQYGHGTRNGGWVEGRDYIMPAIQPVFDKILSEVVKEVTK
jgi:hypothetical protein